MHTTASKTCFQTTLKEIFCFTKQFVPCVFYGSSLYTYKAYLLGTSCSHEIKSIHRRLIHFLISTEIILTLHFLISQDNWQLAMFPQSNGREFIPHLFHENLSETSWVICISLCQRLKFKTINTYIYIYTYISPGPECSSKLTQALKLTLIYSRRVVSCPVPHRSHLWSSVLAQYL